MADKVNISQIEHKHLVESITNLSAGSSLVGEVTAVDGYTHITGFAFSDVSSILNGVIVEQGLQASDFPAGTPATSLVTISTFTLSANDIVTNNYAIQVVAPFARVIFINGPVAQTKFRIVFEARILRGL